MSWHVLTAAGLGFLVAEALLPGVFLIWVGAALIATGLLTLAGIPDGMSLLPLLQMQAVLFCLLLAAGIACALLLQKRATPPAVNAEGSGLLGRTGRVISLDGQGGMRIRLGDSVWAARPEDATALQEGSPVTVTGVDGTVLLVRGHGGTGDPPA